MDRDTLLILYRFHIEANEIMLDTIAHLSHDQFTRRLSPSHDTVRNLLRHILGGDVFFMGVTQGQEPDMSEFDELEAFGSIQARFGEVARDMLRYLETLTDDDLACPVVTNFGEASFTLPLWQTLFQQIMHAHMHRGELSIILSGLGHPLPTIDLFVYFVKASGQAWPFE